MRRLARSPMFTGITLLTLAVGIGANTAIFSVLSGVLLKPLPYPEPERLVGVWETAPGINITDLNASPSTYFTFREEGRVFERLGLWRHDSVSVTGMAEPEQVDALFVTEGTLPALGVPPVKGRWFSEKEDMPGTAGTVMLSYGYWQRRFGGDEGAIGKRLMVDGEAREVIGIMPQSFRFMNSRAALIFPFQLDRNKAFVGNFSYQCLARLKHGVTMARANADVARMLPMMLRKFKPAPGMSNKMFEDARVGPNVRPLKRDVVGNIGDVLWVLMGTVGIVLFIACA
ncbi:MAG: ABC transporter permease, partial [Bryobacterales bacterium]|nr:ABC transporter permease [Bryobacterales bacterium]